MTELPMPQMMSTDHQRGLSDKMYWARKGIRMHKVQNPRIAIRKLLERTKDALQRSLTFCDFQRPCSIMFLIVYYY